MVCSAKPWGFAGRYSFLEHWEAPDHGSLKDKPQVMTVQPRQILATTRLCNHHEHRGRCFP